MSISTPLMTDEAQGSRQELYSGLLNKEVATQVKYGRAPCTVQLTATHLVIGNAKRPDHPFFKIDTNDIVGAANKGKDLSVNKLEIVYYPLQTGCCTSHKDGNVRVKRTVVLDFLDNARTCENWLNVIRYIVSGVALPALLDGKLGAFTDAEAGGGAGGSEAVKVPPPPSRHFLVVVNPVGGKGMGKKICQRYVEPMLKEAGILVTLLVTEYALHAKDAMLGIEGDPAATFQAVLCIGGDGIVFEVVNGLMSREGGEELLRRLPIVHIPGGTANGLAKSVLHACNEACTPMNAVFVAIRGRRQPLDLSRVSTQDGKTHTSFLSLAWGLVSDVDILSESMRYLGESRLYIAAVYFMLRRRYYTGRLRMKLVDACAANPPSCANMTVGEDGWTVIESPFLLVWSVQTSHSGATIHSGPGARLDDGVFTIGLVQEMSRFEMIELLLGIDSGAHYDHPKVKVFKCTEYTLEPLTEKGLFSLDGEVVHYGLLHAKVMPAAATVLCL
jgi:diacylglycerol kinase family enzyme